MESQMADEMRRLAVVTGASSGIGFELAKQCAQNGFDLLIAADEPAVHSAAEILKRHGPAVEAVEADLATTQGVDSLYATAKAQGRPIEALVANAGRGLGHGFLDQDFDEAMRVSQYQHHPHALPAAPLRP
jgi:short-subunit dehydrogenase